MHVMIIAKVGAKIRSTATVAATTTHCRDIQIANEDATGG